MHKLSDTNNSGSGNWIHFDSIYNIFMENFYLQVESELQTYLTIRLWAVPIIKMWFE